MFGDVQIDRLTDTDQASIYLTMGMQKNAPEDNVGNETACCKSLLMHMGLRQRVGKPY